MGTRMDRSIKDQSPDTIEVLSASRWNCYQEEDEILDATGLGLFEPPEEKEDSKQRGSSEEKESDLAPCPPGPPPLGIETKIRSIHISSQSHFKVKVFHFYACLNFTAYFPEKFYVF